MDIAFAPCLSNSWYSEAENLRSHGGYVALVESDLTRHGETMLQAMQARGIKKLLFTGHSLAGGVAQVANLVASGRAATDPTSAWAKAKAAGVEFRTVAFSGPMVRCGADINDRAARADRKPQVTLQVGAAVKAEQTTDDTDEVIDYQGTKAFVDDVASRSANIVFGQDVVPRLPGYMNYLNAVITDVIPQIDDLIKRNVPVPGFVYELVNVDDRLEEAYEGGKDSPAVQDLVAVAQTVR